MYGMKATTMGHNTLLCAHCFHVVIDVFLMYTIYPDITHLKITTAAISNRNSSRV